MAFTFERIERPALGPPEARQVDIEARGLGRHGWISVDPTA